MAIGLENTFAVPVPPEQAWDVLLDVERIAPFMLGASVLAVNGDEIEGQVKVKLSPLSLTYKGTAKFTDKDQANQTITIEASGEEARGAGTASATVQADLRPADAGGSTLVAIHNLLNVTGRPGQFGRSLLPEVSGKLIAQFAANLEAMITADNADAESETSGASGAAVSEQAMAVEATVNLAAFQPASSVVKQEESLNAFKFVIVPVLKRALPIAAVGAALTVIIRRLVGRRPPSDPDGLRSAGGTHTFHQDDAGIRRESPYGRRAAPGRAGLYYWLNSESTSSTCPRPASWSSSPSMRAMTPTTRSS